jgi:hypothetical protein
MSLLDTASLVVTPNGTKAGKLYSVVPSSGAGDLDVTRATTATRVNSSGLIESVASNVPRLDYTNGSCPSILVEPQRTNLVLRSQEFDNGVWLLLNSATVSSNTVNSPDGTQNADTINFGSSDSSLVYQNIIVGSNTYTLSLYAKSSTNKKFRFRNFTGTTVIFSSEFTTTNQWQKFTYTFTDSLFNIGIMNEIAGGVGSIDVYGAQLEAGSYATSYIPTTSASVTRNADVISKTGISSLIGQTEGTVYWEGKANNFNGSNDVWLATISIDNTSTGLLIYHIFSTNQLAVFINNGSTNLQLFKTLNITQNNKIAVAYKSGQYALFVNGVLEDSSTNSMLPASSVNKFHLNEWNNSAKTCTTETKLSALWKTRLTNTQLAQLTTI